MAWPRKQGFAQHTPQKVRDTGPPVATPQSSPGKTAAEQGYDIGRGAISDEKQLGGDIYVDRISELPT